MAGIIRNGTDKGNVAAGSGVAATLSRNATISLARVMVNSLVALVLPAYLTHHLPLDVYAAWVLILQLAAYVSFLDFGVQTAVAKFVAEFKARDDNQAAGAYATAGLTIMSLGGVLGCILTAVLAWQVPRLFHSMPNSLYRDVRISVLLVGFSFSLGLLFSVFSAIFLGLQRYTVPMFVAILNKLLFTIAVLVAVFLHGSLAAMGAAAALINVATGLLQIFAWRKLAADIPVSFRLLTRTILKRVAQYCSMLSIWVVGILCVSGLDIIIVGHYDFSQTGFYSVAVLPTNFAIVLVTSMLAPMVPASSALSTQRTPAEMGDILARTTRYCAILLFLLALPLLIWGFPILRLWVGPVYAVRAIRYLRVLVVANVLRNLCAPYASMVAAIGKQAAGTASVVGEALVNLGCSLYFAHKFGAIGVAWGTMLGSIVSVSLHFIVTMRFTRAQLSVSRGRLLLRGFVRPMATALPSMLLLLVWWSDTAAIDNPILVAVWAGLTLTAAWLLGLKRKERRQLAQFFKARLQLRPTQA